MGQFHYQISTHAPLLEWSLQNEGFQEDGHSHESGLAGAWDWVY